MTLPTKITFETDPRGGILQEWTCQGYFAALRALDLEIVRPERTLFAPGPTDPASVAEPAISILCIDPMAERRSAWPTQTTGDGGYAICILPPVPISEGSLSTGVFSRFDEIWVASAPLAAALACRLPIPVIQLPTVVSAGGYVAGLKSSRQTSGAFTILTTLDLSDLERSEGPISILEAFKRGFERSDDATMIIRCNDAQACRDGLERLQREIGNYPVIIDPGPGGTEDTMTRMATADLYLSLSRFDESSLEIAHAMALGLPVVATGSPGNMEFMSPWNSFPVHVEPGSIEIGAHGPPPLLHAWEPSIEHAGRLLRYLFENREDATARGERARHDISRWHSLAAASAEVARRLETIMGITRSRADRAPLPPAAPPAEDLPEASALSDRMEDLETRMQDLSVREEELRRLLADLRPPPLPPSAIPPPRRNDRPVPATEAQKEAQKQPQPDLPAAFLPAETAPVDLPPAAPVHHESSSLIREVRKAALSVTPFDSVVIVVSGGEAGYLQLEGRTGWHFPQHADARHSDLLPDSASRAINSLEALRKKGGHYIVFPCTAFWWLSLFAPLQEHLEQTGRKIWGDEQCIIYQLAEPTPAAPEATTKGEKSWKIFKRSGG